MVAKGAKWDLKGSICQFFCEYQPHMYHPLTLINLNLLIYNNK